MTFAMIVSSRFRFSFASFFVHFLLRSSFFDDDVAFSLIKFDFVALSIDLIEDFNDVSNDFLLNLLSYLITMLICTLFFLSFTH